MIPQTRGSEVWTSGYSKRSYRLLTVTTYSTKRFLVTGTLTWHACVLEATAPQGWEHQTLAISIKEMLVSGGWWGGGGVPHQFLSSFQGWQFFFGHFLKLVIFKASERERSQVKFIDTKVFPPKDFDAKRACVRAELYHKDESSKLSLLV